MARKMMVACGLLMLSLLPACGQGLKPVDAARQQQMVSKINQTAAGIRSIACSFTQVKTLQFLDDKLTSTGRMLFKADGGRLRWEYQRPYQYTFILNGDKAHIVSAHNKQTIDVKQSRLFQGIAEVMMNSVTGKGLTTSSDFACTMYTAGDEWVARLTPKGKAMKRLFREIRLHVGAQRQMVTKVEMTEQTGDTTVITLKDVKTNGQIDEKMFAAQ
jgi:outer membrane lipoprotein-sorting protein